MSSLAQLIMSKPPLRTGSTAVYPYSAALERKYRFTSRFDEDVPLCRSGLDNTELHLPRGLCPVGGTDLRVEGLSVTFPTCPAPKSHQVEQFDDTVEFLKAGQSGVVLAYTGWGKTVLGYYAAYHIGRKTLVITTKDDIYTQWIAGAKKFLGLKDSEIGEIRGDKCQITGKKFVVAMIHSLSKDGKYAKDIGDEFGLVIFDEVHRTPADQFSAVIDMFPAKLRLGMSATPNRMDGKELLFLAHIGPIRVKTQAQLMIPKVLRFQSSWQCPRVLRTDPETGENRVIRMPHEPGKTARIEKMLAADTTRNLLIAELINNARLKGRKIVIFSTQHEHLKALHRSCQVGFKISGRDMGFYIGAQSKSDKAHREREKVKPIVFTTYAMMSEGTSLDWLDTCLLAMPRSNVEQTVGRIRREYEGKGDPVVMDVIDDDSPVFSGYARKRLQWYKSIEAVVKDMG